MSCAGHACREDHFILVLVRQRFSLLFQLSVKKTAELVSVKQVTQPSANLIGYASISNAEMVTWAGSSFVPSSHYQS